MDYLPAVFAVIVGAAGWFYMFYSRAADRLLPVEGAAVNRRRIRLRRVNGFMMILLAVSFYLGCVNIQRHEIGTAALFLFAVILLMGVILILALVDLRLTTKIRPPPPPNE